MAATDHSRRLVEAVRGELLLNTTITDIVGSSGVVRRARAGRPMPYLTIEGVEEDDAGTFSTDGQEIRLEVHVWCKDGRDATDGDTLKAAIMETLHHSDLGGMAGLVLFQCVSGMGPLPDEDENIAHYVVECRALVGHHGTPFIDSAWIDEATA